MWSKVIIPLFALSQLVSSTSITYTLENIQTHPNWPHESNKVCTGPGTGYRIVGGKRAGLGQFPYIARLGYTESIGSTTKTKFLCAGSIITTKHVITAAHCVAPASKEGVLKLKFARLGEYNAQTDPDCVDDICADPVQDRDIIKITAHSKFNTREFLIKDIAILTLQSAVKFTDWVRPVCLPYGNYFGDTSKRLNGKMVTIAGWGVYNVTLEKQSNQLRSIQVPIVTTDKCNYVFGPDPLRLSQFCAGHPTKDSCNGDSGGPVVVRGQKARGKYFLVGIVSYGHPHCGNGMMAVYTDVPYFMPWILDQLV